MRYKILNTYVDDYNMTQTLGKIIQSVDNRIPIYQVSINAYKINLMKNNQRLREIVARAEIINADGISIVWAAKILHVPINFRVTGVDLFYKLIQVSEQRSYRVYFLGATQESITNMIKKLRDRHPALQIVGYHNGYFQDSVSIIEDINESDPDILFLGFSSPQKEIWIDKYKQKLKVTFIMGVGGSFDIYSGKTKRAPDVVQKLGLEWLYRFSQEPKRMFKRYIIGNAIFVKKVLREKFK